MQIAQKRSASAQGAFHAAEGEWDPAAEGPGGASSDREGHQEVIGGEPAAQGDERAGSEGAGRAGQKSQRVAARGKRQEQGPGAGGFESKGSVCCQFQGPDQAVEC